MFLFFSAEIHAEMRTPGKIESACVNSNDYKPITTIYAKWYNVINMFNYIKLCKHFIF